MPPPLAFPYNLPKHRPVKDFILKLNLHEE